MQAGWLDGELNRSHWNDLTDAPVRHPRGRMKAIRVTKIKFRATEMIYPAVAPY